MSNGEVCCILGICCPPAEARAKLIQQFKAAAVTTSNASAAVNMSDGHLEACADYVLNTFDLAPKGTLSPLVDYIKAHVKP